VTALSSVDKSLAAQALPFQLPALQTTHSAVLGMLNALACVQSQQDCGSRFPPAPSFTSEFDILLPPLRMLSIPQEGGAAM